MFRSTYVWVSILFGVSITCHYCTQASNPPSPGDRVIARVHDRILTEATLNQIIHGNTKPDDSAAIANAYIDQWTRDQLMMQEASRQFAADAEVERMVSDYRARLLKHQLEEKIIEKRFDTTVTITQMEALYEQIKSQFVLIEPVYRCSYYKFSRSTKSLEQFYKDWKKDDEHAIRTFARAYSVEMQVDTARWYKWKEISEWGAGFSQPSGNRLVSQRQMDDKYQYFLKVHDIVDKNEFSPLGYVAPQLKRMLLHKRRHQLLETYKQELHEKALQNNTIQI